MSRREQTTGATRLGKRGRLRSVLVNLRAFLTRVVAQILIMVIGLRQRIIEETDGDSSEIQAEDLDDDGVREAASKLRQPSNEALAKFQDYRK